MRKAAERKLAQSDDGPADAYKIIVIRCGGKQGAIIRELLDRPDDAIWVWDDGEEVHHSLRRLRRLKGAVPEDVSIVECYVATGSSDLRRRLVSEREVDLSHPDSSDGLCLPIRHNRARLFLGTACCCPLSRSSWSASSTLRLLSNTTAL